MGILLLLLLFACYILVIVQGFLAYGTAYRVAKSGGNDGFALFGWLLVFQAAAMVPGLGIYFWQKHRYND